MQSRGSFPAVYSLYLKEKNLKKFNNAPIFIYHGKNDLNCPYELTARFVEKLNSLGVNVEFYFDECAGHSPPKDEEILAKYYEWLNNLIK